LSPDAEYLVGVYGNPSASTVAEVVSANNIRIGPCAGWDSLPGSGLFKMVDVGNYVVRGSFDKTTITGVPNRNMAVTDMGQWTLNGAVGGGTWSRDASVKF